MVKYLKYLLYVVFHLAIWNEHQTKIDMVHKLLRSAQDKLEEQIKMRKEQVSVGTCLCLLLNIDSFKDVNVIIYSFLSVRRVENCINSRMSQYI